jgi:Flp pilus assembly pilin Flp
MKMTGMRGQLKRFAADRCGATAIEYGLFAVIVSITIIAAVDSVGSGSVVGYLRAVIDAIIALT